MIIAKWYKIHKVTAWISGIFFFMLSLTGLLMLASNEIVYIIPEMRPIMRSIMRFHANMSLGSQGLTFLGVVCLIALITIVSGIKIYKPFSGNTPLGSVRKYTNLSYWKDVHRFLGITMAMWSMVLCVTGVMIVGYSHTREGYEKQMLREADMTFSTFIAESNRLSSEEAGLFVSSLYPNRKLYTVREKVSEQNNSYYFVFISPEFMEKNYLRQIVVVPADYESKPLYITKDIPKSMLVWGYGLEFHYRNNQLPVTRMLWMIFSVLTTMMVVSGFYAWFIRKTKRIIIKQKSAGNVQEIIAEEKNKKTIIAINFLNGTAFIVPSFIVGGEYYSILALGTALFMVWRAYKRHNI